MLLYLANYRLPTEKAHGLQIAKMCEALASQGLEVKLVAPTRQSLVKDDLFLFYDVAKNFSFEVLAAPDFYFSGRLDRISFYIKSFMSAQLLAKYASGFPGAVIYSRDEWPLIFAARFSRQLYYEAHKFVPLKKFLYKKLKKKGAKIIVITQSLKKEFLKIGFSEMDILVAPDGVDLSKFDIDITRHQARARLGMSQDKKIVLYAGSRYDWKGVDVLEAAQKYLPEAQVLIINRKPHSEIPYYLKAADVLVLPNRSGQKLSELYTSPLKMFEYMAVKRPIVASDLPSIREILNKKNAVLVESDSPVTLAEGIKQVLSDPELAENLAAQAHKDVQEYSWEKRAKKILKFISE